MSLRSAHIIWGIILLFPICSLQGQSQKPYRCGQEIFQQKIIGEFPGYPQVKVRNQVFYEEAMKWETQNFSTRSSCDIIVIPIVIHIVYDNAISNISIDQINSQIEILNQDFRRLFGTPGYGIGADTEIQFCLASKDPFGNPTSGITRTQSFFSNHQVANDIILKSIVNWDDSMYLNIWVVEQITDPNGNNLLGYATMPDMPSNVPSGVVIQSKNFGNMGNVVPPFDQGRTATHEIGHFLGLYHTFETDGECIGNSENNCLGEGDFICDTPSEQDPKFGCPVDAVNTCFDFPCDEDDLLSNYMNFVDDACMDHFTEGQGRRMRFFLNTTLAHLIAPDNLVAVGCDMVNAIISTPEAAFSYSATTICQGENISFINESSGCVDSILWNFEGGFPERDSSANPVVSYPHSGSFKVSLKVVNNEGNSSKTIEKLIHVAEDTLPSTFSESFEGNVFVPEGWIKEGSASNGSWIRTTFAARRGTASVVLANFTTASCGTNEDLVSPPINLSETNSAYLLFDYSYKSNSADTTNEDQLLVLASNDCGLTFSDTLFNRVGPDLATIPGQEPNHVFIPADSNDWKTATLSLDDFLGMGGLRLKMRGIGRKGQHLYIDHIRIVETVGMEGDFFPEESLNIFPNPFSDYISLVFTSSNPFIKKIKLMDVNGRIIWKNQMPVSLTSGVPFQLDGVFYDKMSPGIYFLEVSSSERRIIKKVIKF